MDQQRYNLLMEKVASRAPIAIDDAIRRLTMMPSKQVETVSGLRGSIAQTPKTSRGSVIGKMDDKAFDRAPGREHRSAFNDLTPEQAQPASKRDELLAKVEAILAPGAAPAHSLPASRGRAARVVRPGEVRNPGKPRLDYTSRESLAKALGPDRGRPTSPDAMGRDYSGYDAEQAADRRNWMIGGGAAGLAALGLGARALARRGQGGLSRNAKLGIGAGVLGTGGLAAALAND